MNTYDYIIVGAGAAGTVIASRLTLELNQNKEIPLNILLIEAGNENRTKDMDENMAAQNPMKLWGDKTLTFNDCVVARSTCQPPRSYPVGKCVGGGSAINGMGAIRGHPEDFKEWQTLTLDEAWNWKNMLNAYKKIECDPLCNNDNHDTKNEIHGNNKNRIPIHRIDVEDWGPVAKAMKIGSEETLGFKFNFDLNSPDSTGVSPFPMNMKKDEKGNLIRVSTNDAYLDPIRNDTTLRNKLTVQPNTLVNRIVFNDDNNRAIGVEVIRKKNNDNNNNNNNIGFDDDETTTIILYATNEIILTSGALYSPAILQRSGVGPKDILNKFNIPVIKECNIGKGLQDHPVINGKIILKDFYDVSKRHANALSRFTSNIGGTCFNDLYFVSVEQGNDPRAQQKEQKEDGDNIDDNFPVGYIDVMLMKCNSRGSVEIQSTDPNISPNVNENMLDDELDKARMRYGIRKLVELFRSPAIETIARKSTSSSLSTDENDKANESMIELGRGNDGFGLTLLEVENMSDVELDEWMVQTLSDGIHICSSCPMSHDGVVDSNGKIRGLESIRICDASVFPTVPRANTHLTVIAAAEIFADKIVNSFNNNNIMNITRLNLCPNVANEIATLILNEWPNENDNDNNPNKLGMQLLDGDTKGLVDTNKNKYMITWVALTLENELAGTIRFCSHDMDGKDEKFGYCWIAALYVKEQYRHQNIGRKLIETVLKYKKDNSDFFRDRPLHLWFPISKQVHLLKFYKSCGFEEVVNEKFTFNKSSFGEDVMVMKEVL